MGQSPVLEAEPPHPGGPGQAGAGQSYPVATQPLHSSAGATSLGQARLPQYPGAPQMEGKTRTTETS